MSAQFAALAGALLRSLFVIGAAGLVVALLRRQSAAARHAVWAGALLALLPLPVLPRVLPPLRIPVLPTTPPAALTQRVVVETDVSAGAGDMQRSGGRARSRYTATRRDPAIPDDASSALIALWLAGVLVLASRRIGSELQVRRLVRSTRAASPALQRDCAVACERVRLRRAPCVLSGTAVIAPAVAGVIRPVLLLPDEAAEWTASDLSAVLAHELGHVRRRDLLVNLLGDVASIIYWCNPAVWLARRRMRAESERACDDVALALGARPDHYADLLLRVARAARPAAPSAATAMARPHQLESRLRALFDERVTRTPLTRRAAALLGATGLLLALPACALTLRAPQPTDPLAPEPDRLHDAFASPDSERLPTSDHGYDVPPQALAALRGPDAALVARLITALRREPQHAADLVRERAAWALSQARDDRLVEPLIAALDAPDWRVQAYAAWALTTARDPRAVPHLIALLDDPVWRVRAMAAAALREAADPRAGAAMTTALVDPAWQVRLEAVGYFISLGGPEMAERVRARRNDRHIAVRLAARGALTF